MSLFWPTRASTVLTAVRGLVILGSSKRKGKRARDVYLVTFPSLKISPARGFVFCAWRGCQNTGVRCTRSGYSFTLL